MIILKTIEQLTLNILVNTWIDEMKEKKNMERDIV